MYSGVSKTVKFSNNNTEKFRVVSIKDRIYGLIKFRSDFTSKSYSATYKEFGITKDDLNQPEKVLLGIYGNMVKIAKTWED